MKKERLLEEFLACPDCRSKLRLADNAFECTNCDETFSSIGGIYSLLSKSESYAVKPEDWDKYDWSKVEEARGRERMRKVVKYISAEGVHLDIGIGRGDGACVIGKKKETIGIDFGMSSLQIAKLKNDSVFQADGRHLPFADEVFSSVTLMDVIEHVPSPHKLMSEIYRVLRRDGRLVLQTPTVEASRLKLIAARMYNKSKTLKAVDRFIQRLRPSVPVVSPRVGIQPYDKSLHREELNEIIAGAGFKIRQRKSVKYFCNILLIQMFCYADLFICEK